MEDRVGPKYCSFSRRGAFRPRTLTVRAEVQPWTDGNGHDKSMICPTSSNSQNLPLRKFFHSSTHRKDQLHIDLHLPRLMVGPEVVMQCFGSDKKSISSTRVETWPAGSGDCSFDRQIHDRRGVSRFQRKAYSQRK